MPSVDPIDETNAPQVPKTELEELQIKAQGVADESLESTRRMLNLCEELTFPTELGELLEETPSGSPAQSSESPFGTQEISPFSPLPSSTPPSESGPMLLMTKPKNCLKAKDNEDEVSKFFSSEADTVRKCDLSTVELMALQVDVLSFIKIKLTEIGKL